MLLDASSWGAIACCKNEVLVCILAYVVCSLTARLPRPAVAVVVAVFAGAFALMPPRAEIPAHLVGHAVENIEGLIPPQVAHHTALPPC